MSRQASWAGECWSAPILCEGISLLCPPHPCGCALFRGSEASPLCHLQSPPAKGLLVCGNLSSFIAPSHWCRSHPYSFYLFIYLFMAVLGLRFCARAFSSCGERGPLFITVCGPLTIAASLVAEHRPQTCRLSSCGSRAQLLCVMWDLPRPGLEPVFPALAGRFSTTAPPGKPPSLFFCLCFIFFLLPYPGMWGVSCLLGGLRSSASVQ